MWSAVAALHAQNSKKFGAAKPAYNYYLSSKLYCGHCKVKMSGISCVNSQKRKIRYYSCRNTVKAQDNCYNRYVRTQKLEETVFSAVKSLLFHTEICDYIAQQLIDYHKTTNDNSNIIRRLLNSKTAIEEANNKLIDAISNGVDTLQMREKIKANEKEIALLSTQIELEKDKNHAELKKEDILKFLTSLNLESIETDPILKRMVIHTFIKYIFLYEDRIVILLNYEKSKQPETPSPNLFNEIEEISKADNDDNISAYTVMSGSPKGS